MPAAPMHVLVVDDEPDTRANLCDILALDDHRVETAGTVAEVLARKDWSDVAAVLLDRKLPDGSAEALLPRLRSLAPDAAVLIDMKLPHGDGATVFRLVRQANPEARTVVITGARSEVDQLLRQVLAEGADAVCYKPFDVPQLLQTLSRLAGDKKEEG